MRPVLRFFLGKNFGWVTVSGSPRSAAIDETRAIVTKTTWQAANEGRNPRGKIREAKSDARASGLAGTSLIHPFAYFAYPAGFFGSPLRVGPEFFAPLRTNPHV